MTSTQRTRTTAADIAVGDTIVLDGLAVRVRFVLHNDENATTYGNYDAPVFRNHDPSAEVVGVVTLQLCIESATPVTFLA